MEIQATQGLERANHVATWPALAFCLLVVLVARVGLFQASFLLEYRPHVSLWFPAAAMTFAAYMVFRKHAILPLMIAAMIGSLIVAGRVSWVVGAPTVLAGGVLYSIVHCAAYCFLAEIVLRTLPEGDVPSLSRTINVFLIGGLVAATIAATGGVYAIFLLGAYSHEDIRSLVLPWMIGDYVGLLVMGPISLCLLRKLADRVRVPYPGVLHVFDDLVRHHEGIGRYGLKSLLIMGMVAVALLLIAHDRGYQPLLFLVFVVIVLQLWMVHAQTVRQSLASIAFFSITLVVFAAWLDLGDMALPLQCATITLAAGSYYGIAVPVLYSQNIHLRKVLTHDALTGAYSRMFFVEFSERAIRKSRASSAPVSMLMIDLDHLKTINDHYGHVAGDQALVHAVDICGRVMGSNDLLGRIGGDEFCAVLPGRDVDEALQLAGRIVQAMRGSRYPFTTALSPSLSIGVAGTRSGVEDDHDSLWLRADSALYVAKRRGRNQVASDREG